MRWIGEIWLAKQYTKNNKNCYIDRSESLVFPWYQIMIFIYLLQSVYLLPDIVFAIGGKWK